jgi:hypothetical protein
MTKRFWTGMASAGLLCLTGTAPAKAQTYLFGGSGTAPGATLNINDTTILNAIGQGWWSGTLANSAGNTNYFVGDPFGDGTSLNDFFTFDLSSFANTTVTSATLSIDSSDNGGRNLPTTYSLYDVSTPAATLDVADGTSPDIWSDLETGNSYGSAVVNIYPNPTLDIALNAQALTDIFAAEGSTFSVGGTLDAPSGAPEPNTWALFAGALLAVPCIKRRRAAKAS